MLAFGGVVLADSAPQVQQAIGNQSVAGDGVWLYTWPTNAFSDADGDALTYTATLSGGGALPSWISFEPDYRSFSGIVATNQPGGTNWIDLVATDPGGLSATNTFSLEILRGDVKSNMQTYYVLAERSGSNGGFKDYPRLWPSTSCRTAAVDFAAGGFSDPDNRQLEYSLATMESYDLYISEEFEFSANHRIVQRPNIFMDPRTGMVYGSMLGWQKIFVEYDERELITPYDLYENYAREVFQFIASDGSSTASFSRVVQFDHQPDTIINQGVPDIHLDACQPFDLRLPIYEAFSSSEHNPLFADEIMMANTEPLPEWLNVDTETGRIWGTAPDSYVLSIHLATTVTDAGSGRSEHEGIYILVEDTPPTRVSDIDDIRMAAGSSTSVVFSAEIFQDVNQSATSLTYRAVQIDSNNGDELPLPDWITFQSSERRFDMDAPTNFNGIVIVELFPVDHVPQDGEPVRFDVGVYLPRPVQEHPLLNQTWLSGQPCNYTVYSNTFVSPESRPLTYTSELEDGDDLPYWLTFDASSRTYSGTPPSFNNIYDIVLTARDDLGASAEGAFTIRHYTTPPAPPTGANTSVTGAANQTLTFAYEDFPINEAARSAHAIQLASLPASGVLQVNGSAATNDQIVTAEQLFEEELTFVPDVGETGEPYTSFTFRIYDGLAWSTQSWTMAISVTEQPVQAAEVEKETSLESGDPDAPADEPELIPIDELWNTHTTRCFPHWMFLDAGQTQDVDVLSLVHDFDVEREGETLELLGFTQPDQGSVALVSNGVLRYTAPYPFIGETQFDYSAGTVTGPSHTSTVHVIVHHPLAPNQPPLFTNTTLIVSSVDPVPLFPEDFAVDPEGFDGLNIYACSDPVKGQIVEVSGRPAYLANGSPEGDSFLIAIEDAGYNASVARITVEAADGVVFDDPVLWGLTEDQTLAAFTRTPEIAGHCNDFCAGTVAWSNLTTGASGTFPVQSNWIFHPDWWLGTNQWLFSATNTAGESTSHTVSLVMPGPSDVYVSPFGNHEVPYDSWSIASTQLQVAVDMVNTGGTVWVTNGTYVAGGAVPAGHSLTNRVLLSGSRRLISINGATETVIAGASDNGTNGPAAVRGIFITGGAVLDGFTISNGWSAASGTVLDTRGGGICMDHSGTVSNCVIRDNRAAQDGGGVYAYYGGTIANGLVTENEARYGGGIYHHGGGKSLHVTVVSNTASVRGGGIFFNDGNSRIINSIVSGNSAPTDSQWATNEPSDILYTCTTPLPAGAGCIETNNPGFEETGFFTLAADSVCIDAGDNAATVPDFTRTPRPLDGNGDGSASADLGYVEYLQTDADSDSDQMPDEWEIRMGMNPTEYDAGNLDPDEDLVNTWREYIADTDPFDANDWFRITGISGGSLFFQSSENRFYTLLYRTNLVDGAWAELPGARMGIGGSDSMTPAPTNTGAAFYRLDVRLP